MERRRCALEAVESCNSSPGYTRRARPQGVDAASSAIRSSRCSQTETYPSRRSLIWSAIRIRRLPRSSTGTRYDPSLCAARKRWTAYFLNVTVIAQSVNPKLGNPGNNRRLLSLSVVYGTPKSLLNLFCTLSVSSGLSSVPVRTRCMPILRWIAVIA